MNTVLADTRVLVVDGYETVGRAVRQLASAWCGVVDHVGGHDEALAMMRRAAGAGRRYDVAIVDMRCGGADGLGAGARDPRATRRSRAPASSGSRRSGTDRTCAPEASPHT